MSSNSFVPEKIVVTRSRGGSGGGYISEIFSLDTWANINGFFALLIFIMFVFIEPCVSGIILVLYCLEIGELVTPISSNIIGILYSGYLIFDIKKEWILSFFLKLFYEKTDNEIIIDFNVAAIITHVILLIFGDELFNRFNQSRFSLFIFIAIVTGVSFLFIKILF